ncbi:hypothetical protein vseg_003485 [Gypsophila vaccaria]
MTSQISSFIHFFRVFQYGARLSLDDGFPLTIFSFKDGLSVTVYPHGYFLVNSGMQSHDKMNLAVLGG